MKAFDYIGHDCLWYKLLKEGIKGNMFNIIHSMYQQAKSQVRVDGDCQNNSNATSVCVNEKASLFIHDIPLSENGAEAVCVGDLKSLFYYMLMILLYY